MALQPLFISGWKQLSAYGGAFFKGKEGRVGFLKQHFLKET